MYVIILLVGPHGAGKGTIAARLEKEGLGVHISTGNLMRSEAQRGTELGMELQAIISAGGYAHDEIALKVVVQSLEKLGNKNALLDGYPRNLKQAEDLENFLSRQGKHVGLVLNIIVDTDALVERMANRLTCPSCQAVYNLQSAKPKVEGKCDKCSHQLVHREEDSANNIKQRLALYEKVTQPMVEFYRGKNLIVEIENNEIEAAVEKAKEAIKAAIAKSKTAYSKPIK